ncbi:unnamed protein product (macronuclear) [Paramecium tetraurelia]|uniref:G8 domain-containing protein n=1 Tax=Paramecium tetraurelia TaxID=5888 RepID=A0BXQ1_PARTE|nr:uncharacterized protein GSPATT00033171001 [Paramecium tetraurelia]CAK63318.1 unnamed protein product [Paramecium tetraurelia]|eukprot:XP_001430716.1 hypothetical protein (macronuclear) [Paramecium tetraurelia strain d4-2]
MKLWVQGGKNTQFFNVKAYHSDTANRIFWQKHRREIFWDQDGSISGVSGGAYIIPYKKHIDGIPGCVNHPEDFWDNSIICAMNQVTIRDVLVNNPTPDQDFSGVDMKLYRLDSTNIALKMDANIDESKYIEGETMKIIKKSKDVKFSFASVFATGFTYNVHFKFGASDPLSMGIFGSPYFNQNDDAVILRFNYSANRETFDIMRNIGGQFPVNYTKLEQIPNTKTCNQGDWFNDRTNKLFFLCLSGKNKKQYEYVEVRGVICREECDSLGDVPQEDGYRYWSDPATWIDNKVPVEGDSPIVQGAYQVILDVDPPKLVNLTILGSLIFDERRASTKLEAERIWVRSGKLLAGNSTNPFPGKINIVLNGEFGDNPLVIDANLDVGNKVLAVTRAMELYSKPPGTVWTRLAAYADAGATTITVAECADWAVGDEIVFGPSGSDPEQREKRSIAAISGCVITLNQALEFDHYGAPSVTIDKPGIGQLDMRAVVGHLTRKIKIEGGPSVHGLGCRVLIYQFEEPEANLGFPRRGYTVLHGVEFNNCGQYDTQRSGLDFRNLNSEIIKTPSEVIGCSFHDTTGMLMTIQNSQYITIKNNIFFTGIKALVQINNSQYVKFQNNALIYVKKRILNEGGLANWAVFGNFVYMDELSPTQMTRDIVDVSGNVGQGSQDTGFFVMASKCSDAYQSSFYNNHCSGTILACFGVRQDPEGKCTYIQGLYAHHSEVGIMYAVVSEQIQLEKSIVVENDRGIALKPAPNSIQENKMKLNNIFISALARPDCVKCYSASLNPNCQGSMGIQMGSLSSSAFPPISGKPSSAFDTICTVQRVDLKVYLTNVEFHNFRLTYDNIPRCQNNAAFRQHHAAHDMTGQHYLVNSPCTNCEFNALLYKSRNPDAGKLGWFGGCGSFLCTGQINFLIEDQTGHFFGQIGQGIGNNTYFGPNVTYCSRQESWNGYWCPGRQATILMFMSTAADYNKRLYSPIKLTDGLFFNEINSFAEWNWDGPEPLNLRESKFVSLVSVNTVINMTNAGMNPTTSEYWLSKRSEAGSPEDWVILKWQFSVPQIIQVMVNNKVVQPGLTTNNKHHDLMTMTNQCGANNYFFENRTIHFVLTGKLDCKIRIALKNTLQVSTRLEITTSEFFGDKFLQYARAQLGGDPYNYFIIGTKKYRRRFLDESTTSSVVIDWGIADSADIGTTDGKQSQSRLAEMASKLESLGVSEELQQLGVVGLKHESSSISSISELNFKSTEQTSEIILVPGGNTNNNNGQGSNSGNNNNNNNNGNNNNNNNNGNGNSSNNDDDIVLVTDEGVNQQDTSNNGNNNSTNPGTIQKSIKRSENSSATVTIVVAVVCSVVGVSLIIAALLYYKKLKLAKLMAARNQKVDNEFFKANITDQQPIEAPQD